MGFLDIFFGNKRVRPDEPAGAQVMTYRAADQTWGPAAAAAGAITRAGGNTTEATTTSTADVNLLTVSSLSIGANIPIWVPCELRKTSGAADISQVGFTVNATVVIADDNWTSATNQAEAGFVETFLYSAQTNYARAGYQKMGGQALNPVLFRFYSADIPIATITSLIVTARSANSLITTGADEMHVYTYAVS